jgi:outer membrane protein insertion porin family
MPLNTVLNLRGKLGAVRPYGGTTVPIYEKFFVGGIYTVRGFEYGWAGPRDVNNEPLGGLKEVVLNSELIFPLSREIGLRGAVFFDIGKGSDTWSGLFPLRTAVGIGIRWFSPFGPIRVDLGFNLNRKDGEKQQVLDFTGGAGY